MFFARSSLSRRATRGSWPSSLSGPLLSSWLRYRRHRTACSSGNIRTDIEHGISESITLFMYCKMVSSAAGEVECIHISCQIRPGSSDLHTFLSFQNFDIILGFCCHDRLADQKPSKEGKRTKRSRLTLLCVTDFNHVMRYYHVTQGHLRLVSSSQKVSAIRVRSI